MPDIPLGPTGKMLKTELRARLEKAKYKLPADAAAASAPRPKL